MSISKIYYHLHISIKDERGAITLEFTLLISFFLILTFYFIELCRIIFLSAAIDLAVAEAGRSASFDGSSVGNYKRSFISSLNENIRLWPFLSSNDTIDVDNVLYCGTVSDLVNDACSETWSSGSAKIAVYRVRYSYHPVLTSLIFLDNFSVSMLSRTVAYVQYYDLDN